MPTKTTTTNNGSTSKRLSGLFDKAKLSLNGAQHSLNKNKHTSKKSEPVKTSTGANVKGFVQSLKSNTNHKTNKRTSAIPPKNKQNGTTSNQILGDLKKGANVVSHKVKNLTADNHSKHSKHSKPVPKSNGKEPLTRRVTRLVNGAANSMNRKTAKA